jgi:hypothetical protein
MSPERRLNARRVLYSPEYLDMGADNGGVVVNLSESGIGFQAVGPVVPEIEIPLSFSLGPGYRIDVKARVVWVNPHGKVGGAIFGKLSKDSRSLIREWLAKPEVENEAENVVIASETVYETEQHAPASAPAVNVASQPAIPAQEPQPNLQNEAVAEQPSQPTVPTIEETAARNGVVLPPIPQISVQPAAEPSPAAPFPAHEIAPPPMPNSVPTREPLMPATVRAPETRISAAPAAPILSGPAPTSPRAPESKRERQGGTSFSAVPSISIWSKNDAPASSRIPPPPKAAGPLFPPRSGENIFARSPSRTEHEAGQRRGSVLLIIAVVIAVGAIVAFYGRTYRQEIGNAIIRMGNSVAGAPVETNTPATPPPAPANSNPAPSNGTATATVGSQAPAASSAPNGLGNSKPTSPKPPATSTKAPAGNAVHANRGNQPPQTPGTNANGQPAQSASTSASSTGSASPASPYPGQAEYQRAESYLNGKGVEQDPAEAAEWFWRSLEAGNTTAAIPLADLYLAGNGVSRSCMQARILLDAAAQKNNKEAIQKLAQLPENCQ